LITINITIYRSFFVKHSTNTKTHVYKHSQHTRTPYFYEDHREIGPTDFDIYKFTMDVSLLTNISSTTKKIISDKCNQ
jgi:hypothetical protein